MVDIYLDILDQGIYEVQEAFKGLRDENVWKRPADGLLSVGEIAGHIAYWEAVKFACADGPEPDLAGCPVKSLLIDPRFRYYTTNLSTLPSPEHLTMTAAQVCSELARVHDESIARFKKLDPDIDSCPSGWESWQTYRWFLKYAGFHIAYHTGQIYSARHLLGEATVDN